MATMIDRSQTLPLPETMRERARTIAPALGARKFETHAARNVPAESIAALREAGLLRVLQPKAWGGVQGDPSLFFDIQNILGEECASTSWVYGVLCVQTLLLARFDKRAQADVWGEDPDTLVCSSILPMGQMTSVEGGYRMTGRWSFASGSSHAKWILVAGREEGAPPPALRVLLVTMEDVRIIDMWDTFGLRGTGSNDVELDDVFVPAYRTYLPDPGIAYNPGLTYPEGELYQLPWMHIFSGCIANHAIGVARGGLKAYLKRARTKVSPLTGAAMKASPLVITAIAELEAEIDAAEAVFRRNFAVLADHVRRKEPLAMSEALRFRVQMTSIGRRLASGLDRLVTMGGAGSLSNDSPITRAWLDLMAARVHAANDPSMASNLLGNLLIESTA